MAELSRLERRNTIKKQKNKGRTLKIVLMSLLCVALLIGGFAIYSYIKVDRFIDDFTSSDEPAIEGEEPVDPKYTEDAFAMVVLGLDTRDAADGLNTDVMIVAVVEPKNKNVTMLSIPRDTVVTVPGYSGHPKINSVYAKGESARLKAEKNKEPVKVTGTSLVKKTLEGLLGIPVKHYITVDFEGFTKVIDELGGIEVDVERRMVYHDPTDGTAIDLHEGLQKLNGKKALDYVRHREDDRGTKYNSSDFDRNRRQQLVIGKVVDGMKSFSGIIKIFDIMDVVGNHIRTDLSKEKIKGLAMDFRSIGSDHITILETGAYWDSHILRTVIPSDKLEEIRLTLWGKMGISESEGKARLTRGNENAVVTLTEQKLSSAKQNDKQKESNTKNAQANDNKKKANKNDSKVTQEEIIESAGESNHSIDELSEAEHSDLLETILPIEVEIPQSDATP